MASNKKDRNQLKAYFVKNSIPTESNFADLIDGMLNQQEDGLVKLPGDPLRINADDNQGLQKVINFYESNTADKAMWSLQLKPRTNPTDTATAKTGFCIAEGQSNLPRLFIDKATGNIGVGTLSPIAQLDIAQVSRTDTHPTTIKGLYITGNFGADSDGVEFRNTDGKQGIGFGYNTIYAAGSNSDQDLQLKAKGTGTVHILTNTNIAGNASIANNLLIGNDKTDSVGAVSGYGAYYAGLALIAKSKTEIAVFTDTPARSVSLMHYESVGQVSTITIGRPIWGSSPTPVNIAGDFSIGNVNITDRNLTTYSLDVRATKGIKFGLEGNGGGQLILTNKNANDSAIFIEAANITGKKAVSELQITGLNSSSIPKITFKSDYTNIIGSTTRIDGNLIVAGNINVLNNGTVTAAAFYGFGSAAALPSDLKLKKILNPLNHALKGILSLRGFSFEWNDKSLGDNREIGVIAQDVEKVFPELVETVNGFKCVRYYSLIAVLIEAMKEQQTQIDALTEALNR